MTIDAATFASNRQPRGEAVKRSYPQPEIEDGPAVTQLVSIQTVVDEKRGKEIYGNRMVEVKFVLLVPGAENDPAGAQKAGHGKPFWKKFHPNVSAGGLNSKGEKMAPSGLYEFLRIAINAGKPLTAAQLGKADDDTLKAFQTKRGLASVEVARSVYAMETWAGHLNKLAEEQPQFNGLIERWYRNEADTTGTPDLKQFISRVKPAAMLPKWAGYQRVADPREQSLDLGGFNCSVTGDPIHGFEVKFAFANKQPGQWITDAEFVAHQIATLGDEAVYSFADRPGETFAAPFSTLKGYYKKAKEQKAAANGGNVI
jgi:hypothetical protein